MKHFDAIIIGTGQAGPPLAARFSDAGKTVVIIERDKFGGVFLPIKNEDVSSLSRCKDRRRENQKQRT
jgi:2-polyprenyl-6-methoxyphenol hydroxylase-like FAD-dependent oxidoreductase